MNYLFNKDQKGIKNWCPTLISLYRGINKAAKLVLSMPVSGLLPHIFHPQSIFILKVFASHWIASHCHSIDLIIMLCNNILCLMNTNNQSENTVLLQHWFVQKSRSKRSWDILNAAASWHSLACLAFTIGNRYAGDVRGAAKGRESTKKLADLLRPVSLWSQATWPSVGPVTPKSDPNLEVYTRRKTNLECIPQRGWMWIRWECSVSEYVCLYVCVWQRDRECGRVKETNTDKKVKEANQRQSPIQNAHIL